MALTTIANVKAILGITDSSQDTLLQNYVDAVSTAISSYCDRIFEASNYNEIVPAQDHRIYLRNQPINTIYFCGTDVESAITVTYTGSNFASIQVKFDRILVNDGLSSTEFEYADYQTITEIASAIASVTNFSTVVNTVGSSSLLYIGQISFLKANESQTLEKVSSSSNIEQIYDGFYSTDRSCPHFVIYNGGYTIIPSDLIEIANKCVVLLYNNMPSGGEQSETIGNYSYTNRINDEATDLVIGDFAKSLAGYKSKVL